MKKQTKLKVRFHPDTLLFEIDGEYYMEKRTKYKKIDGVEHKDYVVFEKVDLEKFKRTTDYIKHRLIGKIPTERVMDEVLKQIPHNELMRIEKILRKKGTKIKRHDGCLGIHIDGGKYNTAHIQLFD